MSRTNVLGIPIDTVSMAQTLACVEQFMAEPRLHQICTVNPEFVMKAEADPSFEQVLHEAELNIADGIGLVWAARRNGAAVPERVPGSELVYHVAQQCAQHGWRLFLLGAADGIAAEAAEKLTALYEGLEIAGTYAGSPAAADNDEIVTMINGSSADILYVAYGAPAQDKWIHRNKTALTTVRVAVGVGGSFDFIAGKVRRAPQWVQHIHLEWFYRIVRQPSRIVRLGVIPRFVLQVWFNAQSSK